MAIYSRFGSVLEITGNCGQHQPKGFASPLTLVRVKRQDDGATRYHFAAFLKADEGINEIVAATDTAPEVTLTPSALKAAIREAM